MKIKVPHEHQLLNIEQILDSRGWLQVVGSDYLDAASQVSIDLVPAAHRHLERCLGDHLLADFVWPRVCQRHAPLVSCHKLVQRTHVSW